VEYHFKDDRLHIMRTVDEEKQLLQRLNRIEGQVRGLRNMIENDRYSGDEVQQASAITAAVREVALVLIAQQLEVGVSVAAGTNRKAAVEEMRAVIRLAVGQCPETRRAGPEAKFD
jgi:DNA-binding FrmR family transcriptional regulator